MIITTKGRSVSIVAENELKMFSLHCHWKILRYGADGTRNYFKLQKIPLNADQRTTKIKVVHKIIDQIAQVRIQSLYQENHFITI